MKDQTTSENDSFYSDTQSNTPEIPPFIPGELLDFRFEVTELLCDEETL